jgi:hypothetical protein
VIGTLSALPLWLIFIISLGLIFGAVEFGRWLAPKDPSPGADTINMLAGAVLGLLALMMSFTFSVSLSRFEARLDAVLNEANAIGTTALRARLLPPPQAATTLKLLRDYTQLRLDVTANSADATADFVTVVERSNAIQEALWQQAMAVAAKDNAMVPTGLYIQALNEMIDDQGERLAAFRNRVPGIVVAALYGIAILAAGFTGYSGRMKGRQSGVSAYVIGFLIASVILLIQDLDRPGAGLIMVSQQPMIDTIKSIASYVP